MHVIEKPKAEKQNAIVNAIAITKHTQNIQTQVALDICM